MPTEREVHEQAAWPILHDAIVETGTDPAVSNTMNSCELPGTAQAAGGESPETGGTGPEGNTGREVGHRPPAGQGENEQGERRMTAGKEDAKAIGQTIYRERILPLLDQEKDRGKVVLIDVHTGHWEIGEDEISVYQQLERRCPEPYTWGERVGYPAMYKLGFQGTYPGFRISLQEIDPREFGL